MKHPFAQTTMLIIFFLAAQWIGLGVLSSYIDVEASQTSGTVTFREARIGDYILERPEVDEDTSFIPLMIAIGIGTGLLLLLIRMNQMVLWKVWFTVAVFISLSISFVSFLSGLLSMILALIVALWNVLKPNVFIHTFAELFLYSGISVLFVPLLSMVGVIALLILISLYDMYAVWKSKHMIKLAEFQTKSGVFAGLIFPYGKTESKKTKRTKMVSVAILGGGDIAFPLLFGGVVLKTLGLGAAIGTSIFVGAALSMLLLKSKKQKFYPAMPFLTAGCFIGVLFMWLVQSFLF